MLFPSRNSKEKRIKEKKLFIFDMDGTIYLGGIPFDFARRFIKNLRADGRKVLFSPTTLPTLLRSTPKSSRSSDLSPEITK